MSRATTASVVPSGEARYRVARTPAVSASSASPGPRARRAHDQAAATQHGEGVDARALVEVDDDVDGVQAVLGPRRRLVQDLARAELAEPADAVAGPGRDDVGAEEPRELDGEVPGPARGPGDEDALALPGASDVDHRATP